MKTYTTILVLFLTVKLGFANDIDSLMTKEDVEKFLIKINSKCEKYDVFNTSKKKYTSIYNKEKFLKLDVDNNGLTDLIINGKYFFVVTDIGNGHYESSFIERGKITLSNYTLINIIYKDNAPLLLMKNYFKYKDTTNNSNVDTLIFKFGDFIEFNSMPDNLKIEKIKFSTSGCFGSCPIFEISILPNGNVAYKAIEYNEKSGKFKAIIDKNSYNNILQTINYIKLPSLKDKYEVNWTDDETVTLEIIYNSGQVKIINDYGGIGTFGLENLYHQLFVLRDTLNWK